MREIETPIEGEWILPSCPDLRMAGVLRIVKGRPAVTLIGQLPQEWEFALLVNPAVILGLTVSGVRVTLLRCTAGEARGAFGGPIASVVTAETMLWGAHAKDSGSVIPELWVRYGDLEKWVGYVPANSVPFLGGEIRRPLTEFKVTVLHTEEMTIEVHLRTVATASHDQLHAEDQAYVVFRPAKPIVVDQYVPWILRFRALLIIATSSQTPITELLAQVDFEYEREDALQSHRRLIPVFGLGLSVPRSSEASMSRHKLYFNLRELGIHAMSLVEGWFSHAAIWAPALDLYAYTAHRSDLIVEEAFLNAVKACESFHRLQFGGNELDPKQHEARLTEITNSAPPQYRRWLTGKLCFSNEPSLRRRLTDLWRAAGSDLTELLPVKRQSFVPRVVAARNYWTHFSPEAAAVAPPLSDLPSLTRWCLILLEFSMLLAAGLPRDQVEQCARRNREFNGDRYCETRDVEYRDC